MKCSYLHICIALREMFLHIRSTVCRMVVSCWSLLC